MASAKSQLSEEDVSGLIGWQPKDQVIFAAMCNDEVDHRVLADLCIDVGYLLDGVVDFGGWLGDDITPKIGQICRLIIQPDTPFDLRSLWSEATE
jgi:hypothetical protein